VTGAKQSANRTEQDIARFSRRVARLITELRNEGQHDGAARLEATAIAIVAEMRRQPQGSMKR